MSLSITEMIKTRCSLLNRRKEDTLVSDVLEALCFQESPIDSVSERKLGEIWLW